MQALPPHLQYQHIAPGGDANFPPIIARTKASLNYDARARLAAAWPKEG